MPKRRVSDPENPPLTAADFAQMRPALDVMPTVARAGAFNKAHRPRRRNKPK